MGKCKGCQADKPCIEVGTGRPWQAIYCLDCLKGRIPSQARLVEQVINVLWEAEDNYKRVFFYPQDLPGGVSGAKTHGFSLGFNAKNMRFNLSEGWSPTDAVTAFFNCKTVCECHSLLLGVLYKAVLDCTGTDVFDLIFSKICVENGFYYGMNPNNPIRQALRVLKNIQEADIGAGDWVYTLNVSDYLKLHPGGAAAGWNLVCVATAPTRLYLGFGLRDPDHPDTPPSALPLGEVLRILQRYRDMPPNTEELANLRNPAMTGVDTGDLAKHKSGVNLDSPCLDLGWGIRRLSRAKLLTAVEARFNEEFARHPF